MVKVNPLLVGRHPEIRGVFEAASGEVVELVGDFELEAQFYGVDRIDGDRAAFIRAKQKSDKMVEAGETNYVGFLRVYTKDGRHSLGMHVLEVRNRDPEDKWPHDDVVIVIKPPYEVF